MGDEMGFNQKWDFRRKENSSDDSPSDNPQSSSSHEPVLKKHKLVSQPDKGTTTSSSRASRQQQGKTRKSSSKKSVAKPTNPKKTGRATKKIVCAEEGDNIKKRKRPTRKHKPDDDSLNGIGVFMDTLLDDLKASRETLFGWMSAEICKSDGDNAAASPKKETKAGTEGKKKKAQPRRPKRATKSKKVPEAEKTKKMVRAKGGNQKEVKTKPEERIAEKNVIDEAENGCGQGQELGVTIGRSAVVSGRSLTGLVPPIGTRTRGGNCQERCNAGFDSNSRSLERFLNCGEAGNGQNCFQQQDEGHGNHRQFMKLMTSNDEDKAKSLGSPSTEKQKNLVLGICAQNCSLETPERHSRGKKTTVETNPGQTRDVTRVESVVLSAGTQKDRNFEIPSEPKLSSSLLMPVASSLCSSFPSNPGIASFASNNFQLRSLSQIQHSPEIQAESSFAHVGLRNLSCLYPNNAYHPGFLSSGFNFPTQVSSDNSRRDNGGNMLGALRMSGGAIRFSGGILPENFAGADISNNFSDYRTISGRQMQFQTQHMPSGNGSLFHN